MCGSTTSNTTQHTLGPGSSIQTHTHISRGVSCETHPRHCSCNSHDPACCNTQHDATPHQHSTEQTRGGSRLLPAAPVINGSWPCLKKVAANHCSKSCPAPGTRPHAAAVRRDHTHTYSHTRHTQLQRNPLPLCSQPLKLLIADHAAGAKGPNSSQSNNSSKDLFFPLKTLLAAHMYMCT